MALELALLGFWVERVAHAAFLHLGLPLWATLLLVHVEAFLADMSFAAVAADPLSLEDIGHHHLGLLVLSRFVLAKSCLGVESGITHNTIIRLRQLLLSLNPMNMKKQIKRRKAYVGFLK